MFKNAVMFLTKVRETRGKVTGKRKYTNRHASSIPRTSHTIH